MLNHINITIKTFLYINRIHLLVTPWGCVFHIKLPFKGDLGPRDFLSISITIDMTWITFGHPPYSGCSSPTLETAYMCIRGHQSDAWCIKHLRTL